MRSLSRQVSRYSKEYSVKEPLRWKSGYIKPGIPYLLVSFFYSAKASEEVSQDRASTLFHLAVVRASKPWFSEDSLAKEGYAPLHFNWNDLFQTQHFYGKAKFQNMDSRFATYNETRVARLTFIYNFGNRDLKGSDNQQTVSDDEQRRMN